MRITGSYVPVTIIGQQVQAFVPLPLPPSDLDLSEVRLGLVNEAVQSLRGLDLASKLVMGQEWLLSGFVRKEAVVSSQIDGTRATLLDLLDGEEDKVHGHDLEEICNYLSALNYTWDELSKDSGLPLSLRHLKEAHRLLMKENRMPGEFRKSQNWIGGASPKESTFIPPPPDTMVRCLNELEQYFHTKDALPPLIRVALIHVQFESIHPFLDGNGRIGRLLIALLLRQYGLLQTPLFYVSLYFKKHRSSYYELLNRVRKEGDWEAWIEFFLKGVKTVADDVVNTARRLYAIVSSDRECLLKHPKLTVATMRLFEELPKKPIITIGDAVQKLNLTKPPVAKAMMVLVDAGVLVEVTGKKRDRSYRYQRYLDVLAEGTEL